MTDLDSGSGESPASEEVQPPRLSLSARALRVWRGRRGSRKGPTGRAVFRDRALTAVEIAILLCWTLAVTRPYLNFAPDVHPAGREFLANIQTHSVWTWLRSCGACAMWFGSVNGGWPVPVDVNASTLHPLVALTTLGWGVANGAKLTLVFGFFIAGLGQWWLARVLGLGRVARIWSACIAVAGGHLASRMDLGSIGLVLSTAAASLVGPPLIALALTGRYRNAVLLGLALALLAVSGQGYIQVGVAFLFPLALLLLPRERRERMSLLRKYGLAIGIGGLLAAPIWVPFLHFYPQFGKDVTPTYPWSQPLAYIPLNLFIDDREFYLSGALGRVGVPWPYVIFIGWVPVLLAVWGLRGHRNGEERRIVTFLVAISALAFWLASAGPFKILLKVPSLFDFLAGLRYTSLLAGLAVSPILGLAGIGLDKLLALRWPSIQLLGAGQQSRYSLDLRWLAAIPLVAALLVARKFSMSYIQVLPPSKEGPAVLSALRTDDLEWVSTPFGEHFWNEPAIRRGLKLAKNIYLSWHWRDRPSPEPALVATRGDPGPGMTVRAVVDGIQIAAAPPGQEYAAVQHADDRRTVCSGRGIGGDIDVTCTLPSPGVLTVKENAWSGWGASVAKERLPLLPGRWLSVRLPAGTSTVRFRYRPWDMPVGIFLCLAGVGLAVMTWLRNGPSPTSPR